MARKLRIQFPGAIYHVMSRGDRREAIFRDDIDRESFLQTMGDACIKTNWQIHAFCLMPNHFHLVLETPQPNLVVGMKWFLGTYTTRFNRRHKLTGHVFAGRYKSLIVGGEGGYLRTVCDYVHLNPVRAKLIAPNVPLRNYRWSSFPGIVGASGERPEWLRLDRLLGESGIQTDDTVGRTDFEQRMEARRNASQEEFQAVRRGWCFGDESFRSELLERVEGEALSHHFGAEIHEASEARATRIVDEELRRALWTEADLKLKQKGHAAKLQIARRLRAETTVTLQWIAARLHMGTKTHLSHLLYWQQRALKEGKSVESAKAATKLPAQEASATKIKTGIVSRPRVAVTETAVRPVRTPPQPTRGELDKRSLSDTTLPLTDPTPVGGFDTSFD